MRKRTPFGLPLPSIVFVLVLILAAWVHVRQVTHSHADTKAVVQNGQSQATAAVAGMSANSSTLSSSKVVPTRTTVDLNATDLMWNHRPVYYIQNLSANPLHHVSVLNWSGERLSPLYIGTSHQPQLAPLNHPPYTLQPGERLWFAGMHSSATRVTIEWLENGVSAYENLQSER